MVIAIDRNGDSGGDPSQENKEWFLLFFNIEKTATQICQ